MNPAPPLPNFEISKLDKLETYALAMLCTQAEHKAATEPPATLVQLANEAIATRAVLLADVNSLISRGLLAPSAVDGLQGVHRYKNVMMDICTLASVLKKNAAKIAERTSVRREELTTVEDSTTAPTAPGNNAPAAHPAASSVAKNGPFMD